MEQRHYHDLTNSEIANRLQDIEREVHELKNRLVTSEGGNAESRVSSRQVIPEFQRLGEEQIRLFQELAARNGRETPVSGSDAADDTQPHGH